MNNPQFKNSNGINCIEDLFIRNTFLNCWLSQEATTVDSKLTIFAIPRTEKTMLKLCLKGHKLKACYWHDYGRIVQSHSVFDVILVWLSLRHVLSISDVVMVWLSLRHGLSISDVVMVWLSLRHVLSISDVVMVWLSLRHSLSIIWSANGVIVFWTYLICK
jgi:hypothetical protein